MKAGRSDGWFLAPGPLSSAAKVVCIYLAGAFALAMVLTVIGCAAPQTAPTTVRTAIAEPPCSASRVPLRPTFPADTLRGDEDIFTLGKTIWADRLARRAYEKQLEALTDECTKATAR